MTIAYPGNRPPFLCPLPCSYRGAIWNYAPATPDNARLAIGVHEELWPDWPIDDALISLAAQQEPSHAE